MTTTNFDTSVIDDMITGYLPHSIYAFETNTHPNYLKVGDTNRRVETRLNEWRKVYRNLVKKYEAEAMLEDENGEKTIFFRDFALHDYLLNDKKYNRLSEKQFEREFFENATISDVEDGINDIKTEFIKEGTRKYNYYKVGTNNTQVDNHWKRTQDYSPRPNQEQVIKNIVSAVEDGRNNLLLYAVMRFGKSNVAIWSAKELNSKLTVIVTGKADVKTEWQKTVESHKDFENFVFTDSTGFTEDYFKEHQLNNIVVFTTLQDLAGSQENIKGKHELLFSSEIDFLVIDESHFGARAKIYSKALINKEDEDFDELKEEDFDKALENINSLNTKVKLHLSGTPYRILLSGEFSEADIVGKVQFTDILESKNEWISKYIEGEEEKPWENPYFGFAEMVRFAFTPNKSSIELLNSLKENGESAELNVLFAPDSTAKNKAKTTKFKHESEVLNLLKAIDGSEEDDNIFPFLDYKKIKDGRLAQHIVFVLPYKNSADAMERLLIEQRDNFKNLGSYQILNVAGNTSKFKRVTEVQNKIKKYAEKNQKTLTLTVNKMLTGSTVPEWDTMVFLKDTKSPQDYDQAIFRLQSPWIKEIKDVVTGETLGKEDMKPQTLLIDFSPNRMFKIESERALVVNASEGKAGNEHQEQQLRRSMVVSPIIYLNRAKLVEATPTDIIAKIREYSADKSIIDEVVELPVDDLLYNIPEVLAEISSQSELSSKAGFETSANEEGDTNLDGDSKNGPDNNTGSSDNQQNETGSNSSGEENKPTAKQMQMYYSRLLFYAFLSPNNVKNLSNIIESIDENQRLARHLGLRKPILEAIKAHINPYILAILDNKIENIGDLRSEATDDDILKAIAKFGRISPSEVFTPIWVARMMVDKLMDEEFINEYKESPKNIIDLSTKSGVYLIMAYQKLSKAGVDKEVLKNKLFAVATSHVGYEFTRAVYEEFGWDLENIVDSDVSNSYQLIAEESVEKNLKELFGDENLKFDIVIGNPPYQEEAKGTSSSDDPIYNFFMDEAYKLASKVSFITPARFLFNAGKTPKAWNKKMLNDTHLKVEYYEQNSAKVFPNTDIKGGVVVTYRNSEKEFGAIGAFTHYPELSSILKKVESNETFHSITDIIFTQSKFDLEKLYQDYPLYKEIIGSNGKDKRLRKPIFSRLDIFTEEPTVDSSYKILGRLNNQRVYRYIPKKYIADHENLLKYKVLVPTTNGTGAIGEILSTPLIGEPLIGYTDTFISFGAFDDEEQAKAMLKYIKTKFCRTMLGMLKITQDNTAVKWAKVPLQDFTSDSVIDWSKSVSEIDQQLYKLYGLDEKEISFIEEKVKSME